MPLEENNQNAPDIDNLIKSFQEENKTRQNAGAEIEPFVFGDNFDIDAFVGENGDDDGDSFEKTLTSVKTQRDNASSDGGEERSFNVGFQNDLKDQSIKNLEEKIAELETRFEDINKDKSLSAAFAAELAGDKEEERYTPGVKANDEFFHNISNTIETLKGSLENIVSARLQYEENLIRQDQSLITRLRDKTSRLKAINIALNSEVKRAKNEKLESLRRSAEQTKELLSLRMQLSRVEEKAKHGDFKLANLEQQLASVNSQKELLDAEISKIREEKLSYLRQAAQQTKEIMSFRFELGKAEEKFKQEEIKASTLQEQLKNAEDMRALLDKELYSSRSQREEANRKIVSLEKEAQTLRSDVERSSASLQRESSLVVELKEKIIILETELRRLNSEKAGLFARTDENLRRLEAARAEQERAAEKIRTLQAGEFSLIKDQKGQESQTILAELRRAEDKYRQEETFVNTLKLQIEALKSDIRNLESEKSLLKDKSLGLAKELDSLNSSRRYELENLNRELRDAQEKLSREQHAYRELSERFAAAEAEKAALFEQISKLLAAKDEALKRNDEYTAEIKKIKAEHRALYEKLNADIAELKAKNEVDTSALKEQISFIEKHKPLIDGELKKANEERFEILRRLEQKTKEFEEYRVKYEQEISTLREEKTREINSYRGRLENAERRLKDGEVLIEELKTKIANRFEQSAADNSASSEALSAAISRQTEEIVSLKNNLAKAESRFAQDTVLVNQLKEQLSVAAGAAAALEQEVNRLKEENAAIRRDLSVKEEELLSLRNLLSKTQQELEQESAAAKQLKEHTSRLKAVNSALDTEVRKVQAEKFAALKKSAEQAKEILFLKEQLTKAESGFSKLDFENGIISIRKEYEAKVENLETQLKDVSAKFAEQVKEIQNLKADNTQLKDAQTEKIKIEEEYKILAEKAASFERQIKRYEASENTGGIAVKIATLTAQLVKVKKEKISLEQRIEKMQRDIEVIVQNEKEKTQIVSSLKEKISDNDVIIEKLKKDIILLAAENRELKFEAEKTVKRENILRAKISEIEGEKKKLETFRSLSPTSPHIKQTARRSQVSDELQSLNTDAAVSVNSADNNLNKNKEPISVLNLTEAKSPVEIIDIKGNSNSMDLSMIFDKSASSAAAASAARPSSLAETIDLTKTELSTETSAVTQDHAAKIVIRQPMSRVPQSFRESEAYSDFLKKTKSVFYRIKWSLFKDQ